MNATLFHSAFVALVLVLTMALPVQAAVVNGGFETGTFAGWSVVGDTSVQTASVGISPTGGCCMALLTTLIDGVPFSTHFASSFVLQTFLGYSLLEVQNFPFAYPGRNAPYVEGQSAIKQTVQGHAGELLSFDAYWVTTDGADNAVLSVVPSTSGPKVLVFLSPPIPPGRRRPQVRSLCASTRRNLAALDAPSPTRRRVGNTMTFFCRVPIPLRLASPSITVSTVWRRPHSSSTVSSCGFRKRPPRHSSW